MPLVLIGDVLPSRLELARSLGLATIPAGEAPRTRVMELSNRNDADLVFECAGHPSSAREMTSLIRSRGVVVNIGVRREFPLEEVSDAFNLFRAGDARKVLILPAPVPQ
ncbi:MAG: zinc-binding dehydrogenase [Bryobacteraceae bacterium]